MLIFILIYHQLLQRNLHCPINLSIKIYYKFYTFQNVNLIIILLCGYKPVNVLVNYALAPKFSYPPNTTIPAHSYPLGLPFSNFHPSNYVSTWNQLNAS